MADSFVPGPYYKGEDIASWEKKNWLSRAPAIDTTSSDPIYFCGADTTFAVYDRDALLDSDSSKSCLPDKCYTGVRVAGTFTAIHLPWLCFFPAYMSDDEFSFYKTQGQNNASTMSQAFARNGNQCKSGA